MPKKESPTWLRWHQLPPELAQAIADDHQTVYLALHLHNNRLAILTVPAVNRIHLSDAAAAGSITTRTVTMTIVHRPPSCTPRGPISTQNHMQKR